MCGGIFLITGMCVALYKADSVSDRRRCENVP